MTNANNEVTRTVYDFSGNAVQLIDGKNQTNKFAYDQMGRLTNQIDAAGNVVLTNSPTLKMQPGIRNGLVVWVTICLLLVSCADSDPLEIGDGFFLDLHRSAPTLHMPGYFELWTREGRTRVTIWNGVSETLATNGICLFTTPLSGKPLLLAYRSPGPPVEISERVTKKYLAETNQPDKYKPERFRYTAEPKFANGAFLLVSLIDINNHIEVRLSVKEMIQIIESVQKSGVLTNYDGNKYRVDAPSKK